MREVEVVRVEQFISFVGKVHVRIPVLCYGTAFENVRSMVPVSFALYCIFPGGFHFIKTERPHQIEEFLFEQQLPV